MANNRSHGVFVLGMHRSGTSAAVLSLESLGLKLCGESDRLREGPGNSNPDHGESVAVITENDALLDLRGGSWIHPRLDPSWLNDERVAARKAAAATTFATSHPAAPWACKDPRLCLTLPFWEQALSSRHPVVIVVRHPQEIVKSLQTREAAGDPQHSSSYYLALWERYTRSALIHSLRHPVYVLDYHELMDNWDNVSARLSKWLRRHGIKAATSERSPIDATLHHSRAPQSLNGLTPDQRRLHNLVASLNGPHRNLRVPNLGRETPRTSALFGPGPQAADAGFLTLPAVKALTRRFAQINPLASRRFFVLGAAAATLLVATSVTLMRLSQTNNPTAADGWLTEHLVQPHWPAFDNLLQLISNLTSRTNLNVLAAAALAALLLWRKFTAATTLAAGLLITELITTALRGQSHDPASFFGGHSFRAAVLLGLMGYFGFRLIKSQMLARGVATASAVLICLVAVSRVYLQSHYPSAILASVILGAAVSVLLIAGFESVQKSPHRLPPPQRRPARAKLSPGIPLDDIS